VLERRSAPDGRARALFLTRAGQALASRILAKRARALLDVLAPLSADERRQLEPVLEKLLGGVVMNRWDARRVCRLCDFPTCADPDCPVDVAAGDEGVRVAIARA
jgi:hypothetical protein